MEHAATILRVVAAPNPPIAHGSSRLTSASGHLDEAQQPRIHQQHDTEQQAQADEMEDLANRPDPWVVQHEVRSHDRGIRPGRRIRERALREDFRVSNLAADRRGARDEDEADERQNHDRGQLPAANPPQRQPRDEPCDLHRDQRQQRRVPVSDHEVF